MGKYYGRYDRNLDDRGRLQLPAKLILGSKPESFFALRGFEGCLSIYEKEAFNHLQEELSLYPFLKEEARAFKRLTLSSVRELEVDAHGRISLTRELLDRYHLGVEVIVLGVDDHFEVWDKKAYEAYEEKEASSFEKLAETLGEINK